MNFEDITVVGGPIVLSTGGDVDAAETQLGSFFPTGYREYVTEFGEGILGGCYIRIFPPRRVLNGANNLQEWRERINQYWFWNEAQDVLTKEKALECIIIGDTMDGDELIFHPSEIDRIYILPKSHERIFVVENGLREAIEWLCSSGVLTEPFKEREFEPFDSRQEA